METIQARYKVDIDLNVTYRNKEGVTEEYLKECVAEIIKQHINNCKNGRAFNVNNIKLTKQ